MRVLGLCLCVAQAVAQEYPNNLPNAAYLARYKDNQVRITAHFTLSQTELCSVGQYKTHKKAAELKGLDQDEEHRCTFCPPGKYQFIRDAQYCFHCSSDTYSDTAGGSKCKACPEGKYGTKSGAFCVESMTTPPPTPHHAESWKHCPAGHYNHVLPVVGHAVCLECPHGYIQPFSGSASCEACPKGHYNPTEGDKSNVCVSCGAGKYQPEASSTTCFDCAAGTTSDDGSEQCAAIPVAETQQSPSAESAPVPHDDDKIECPADSRIFQDFHGFKYCISNVQSCPAGMHAYEENHEDAAVLAKYHCAPCPAGKFSKSNSACTACPEGKYGDEDRAVLCKSCKPGKITATTGNSVCSLCATGTYQSHSGKTACVDCYLGRTSAEDGTECKGCTPGTYNPSTASACKACPSGKFSMYFGATDCQSCFENMVSFDGDEECHHCGVGQYAHDFKECVGCPAGYSQPEAGQGGCIKHSSASELSAADTPAPAPAPAGEPPAPAPAPEEAP